MPEQLKIYVCGHEEKWLSQVPKLPFLVPLNLNDLEIGEFQDNRLAESRVFLAELPLADYVGFVTARWPEKFSHLWTLDKLQDLDLKPNVVYGPAVVTQDMMFHSEVYHPGMGRLLTELKEQFPFNTVGTACWCNNFICAKRTYLDFREVWREQFQWIHQKYGYELPYEVGNFDERRKAAYFYERLTVIYFSNKNYIVRQIPHK
jgi:hypothetical protein